MTGRLGKASPRTRARLTGVVYLLFFATGDAAATANNILAHQLSFQLNSQWWTEQAA